MLDIGFSEIVVIGVIALVVIGPERLPKLARTVGLYLGRLRRFVTDVRSDVERELQTEEVRRAMNEIAPVQEFYDVVEEAKSVLTESVGPLDEIRQSVDEAREALTDAGSQLTETVSEVKAELKAEAVGAETSVPSGAPGNGVGDSSSDAPGEAAASVQSATAGLESATHSAEGSDISQVSDATDSPGKIDSPIVDTADETHDSAARVT
jgi:sec-independent protein translocase protein TatB